MSPSAEFERFFLVSRDRCLRAVTVAVGGDRVLAEDLVAEAFARAWSHWRRVAAHPRPEAWIVRTALNLRVSLWRRRRREQLSAEPPLRTPPDAPAVEGLSLLDAVAGLPARQREVVALRVLLEFDTEETASALRIAPGTVTAHLHRALKTLRTIYEEVPEP